jgi:hypothetical protein
MISYAYAADLATVAAPSSSSGFSPGLFIAIAVVVAAVAAVLYYRKHQAQVRAAEQAAMNRIAPGLAPASPVPVTPAVPVVQAPSAPAPAAPVVTPAPAHTEEPPTPPVPATMLDAYIDRDDLMKAIGATGCTSMVTLDGEVVHNGFGPPLAYVTTAGNVKRAGSIQTPSAASPPAANPSPPVASPALVVNSAGTAELVRLAPGRSIHIVQGGSVRFIFNSGTVAGMLTVYECTGGGYGPDPLPMSCVITDTTGAEVGTTDGMTISWRWAVGQGGIEANTDYVATIKRDDSCIAVDFNVR